MSGHTVDQANITRCCGPDGCGGNSAGEPDRYCIASACMAWRWAEPYVVDQHGTAHNYNRKADDSTGPLTKVQHGYCGLAGYP